MPLPRLGVAPLYSTQSELGTKMIYVDFVDGQLFESTNDTDTTGSNYGSNASVKKIDFTYFVVSKIKTWWSME